MERRVPGESLGLQRQMGAVRLKEVRHELVVPPVSGERTQEALLFAQDVLAGYLILAAEDLSGATSGRLQEHLSLYAAVSPVGFLQARDPQHPEDEDEFIGDGWYTVGLAVPFAEAGDEEPKLYYYGTPNVHLDKVKALHAEFAASYPGLARTPVVNQILPGGMDANVWSQFHPVTPA
jgi:hypothetical protein